MFLSFLIISIDFEYLSSWSIWLNGLYDIIWMKLILYQNNNKKNWLNCTTNSIWFDNQYYKIMKKNVFFYTNLYLRTLKIKHVSLTNSEIQNEINKLKSLIFISLYHPPYVYGPRPKSFIISRPYPTKLFPYIGLSPTCSVVSNASWKFSNLSIDWCHL